MTPEETLRLTNDYLRNLQEMKKKYVAVGLPAGKVTGKVYGNGFTVVDNGIVHEFGAGNVPERSFLRAPFTIKKSEINKAIEKQFANVGSGRTDADTALNLIGVVARNISVEAFDNGGYGTWPDITQDTKDAKGSSAILIAIGLLRGSITWEVR